MATLTFGKHAGKDLRDVPRDYVEWLIDARKQDLSVYEAELARRDAVESANESLAEKIVSRGFRELAKSAHPDHGGTAQDFQALKAAHEVLKVALRALGEAKTATAGAPDDGKAPW